MIKGLKIYVYILSMQDLIIKLFLKLSDVFLITSLICSFQVRLLDMVIPNSFALVTLSSSLPSITIRANWGSFFTKDILSSLHFSLIKIIRQVFHFRLQRGHAAPKLANQLDLRKYNHLYHPSSKRNRLQRHELQLLEKPGS